MPGGSLKFYLLLIVGMIFWGGSWVSAKIVVTIAPPLTIGFFRFLSASIFFLPVLCFAHRESKLQITKRDIGVYFILGLTGIFGYGVLFLTGMRFTTAAQGAIIAGVNPTTVSLLAHITHKERLPSTWRYTGYVLSFLGIIFVVGIQSFLQFRLEHLLGNTILLVAMILWGIYSILGKSAMQSRSSLETTTGGILLGTLLFGAAAIGEQFWLLPAMADPTFWFNVLYMGIFVTFLGFFFYFLGIKNLGASQSAIFISLVPVFGTLFSALILFEPIYWTFILGLLLVIGGILLINYPRSIPE